MEETSKQVNKIAENVAGNTEQVKETTDNDKEIINYVKQGNTTEETSQLGQSMLLMFILSIIIIILCCLFMFVILPYIYRYHRS